MHGCKSIYLRIKGIAKDLFYEKGFGLFGLGKQVKKIQNKKFRYIDWWWIPFFLNCKQNLNLRIKLFAEIDKLIFNFKQYQLLDEL